jgi:hypothetical protein
MTHWTRALGWTLLMALSSCVGDATNGTDAGVGDGGACLYQLECACTCICAGGAQGTTYSECVSGYCSPCGSYCNAFCG